ncbi:MAG TPA: ABC transporter substrate-binding protein [Actinomycetota bacterium]|nr:ABC transporter substrate-binding protein [Actinomycetota bacterium]
MYSNRRRTLIALCALLLIVAAACGQKPGVGLGALPAGAAGENIVVDPETGALVNTETGEIFDPETGEVISTGSGGIIDSSGDTTSQDSGSGSTSGSETGGGSQDPGETEAEEGPEPSGGDATGVEGDVIKIGIHAPITGAAPVPSSAFEAGKDLYWNWLKENNVKINGRDVEVVFRNDNYNPSQAVAACKEMVEQEKVFMLFGLAGVDQIQACARYAASVGVPYLSAGVTEIGLSNLPSYFALWMSYAQQGPLLADLLVTKLGAGDEVNGMVRFNTPGFQDAHDAYISGMSDAGADVAYDRAVSKTAGQTDAQTIATELNQQGVENVYVLTSPVWFIQLLQAAQNQGYHPQWVGVGLSMGIDTVPNVACRNQNSIQDARFLNPFPAVVDVNKYDPDFTKAGGRTDTSNGSIELGLWGMSKVAHQLLLLPGDDLTRERFVYFAERAQGVKTGVFPDLNYAPDNHLGGDAMHLLRADCSQSRWITEQSFVSDF